MTCERREILLMLSICALKRVSTMPPSIRRLRPPCQSCRKKPAVIKKKKDYTPFPPPQLPSKEDLLMEAGEYFQSQSKKRQRAEQDRAGQQAQKAAERRAQRQAAFQPPEVRYLALHLLAATLMATLCPWRHMGLRSCHPVISHTLHMQRLA